MKYPVKVKYRSRVLAKIYAPGKNYPLYRLAWTVQGKRVMKAFDRYGSAKRFADDLVQKLAKGDPSTTLSAGQARDAIAALERMQAFYQTTGIKLSLLGAVSEYCEAASQLNGKPLSVAVTGYLTTVINIKRVDLKVAVEEFLSSQEPRSEANNGERAQISPKYSYNRQIVLRRFAGFFPGTAVADLTTSLLDKFFEELGKLPGKGNKKRRARSAKSRNHYRSCIKQFLDWSVRKDYLGSGHRLNEADGLRAEHANTSETQFYSPSEFKSLLDNAQVPLKAMIALGGLSGARTQELLRMSWEDTRNVSGHIEITSAKSKTRQRRLVPICPALSQWLAPFKDCTGPIWEGSEGSFQKAFLDVCKRAEVQRKPNGLRHSFCSYHLAAHGNENSTSMAAGHTPQMLFAHYRGLARQSEGEQWFAVSPAKPANVIPLDAAAKA